MSSDSLIHSLTDSQKAQKYLVFGAFGLQNETIQFFGLESGNETKRR